MLFFLLACASASPPPVPSAPVPPPPEPAFVLTVPRDCPHLIVDLDSTGKDGQITIACFMGSETVYRASQHGPPLGNENEPGVPTRFTVQYVDHAPLKPPP